MVNEPRQYEVLQVLGAGGFGTVYRARFVGDVGFSKEVALKVLNADMADVDEVAARLRDEARVLGLLRHRAIVHVDRLVLLEGRWTIVMEYVEGVSLARLIRLGPVPVAAALEITSEIAAALNVAYTRPGPNGQPLHLLHRDIKPSNIQLTVYGEVKVLDFGIARAEFETREALTRSLTYGTPEYMSPERLDMAGDGPEGDVYALGAVLLEMISGRAVGRSSARRDRHEGRIREAMAGLDDVPGVTPAVRALIASMLSWEPGARPTAGDVERIAVRLRNLHHDEPLRTWTETVIPPLLAAPVLVEEHASGLKENLSGATLTERASSGANPKPRGSRVLEIPSIPTLEADRVVREARPEVASGSLGSSGAAMDDRASAAAKERAPDGRSRKRRLIILILAFGLVAVVAVTVVSVARWGWSRELDPEKAPPDLQAVVAAPQEQTAVVPPVEPVSTVQPQAVGSATASAPSSSTGRQGRPAADTKRTRPAGAGAPPERAETPAPPPKKTATVQVGRTDGARITMDGRSEPLTTGLSLSLEAEKSVVVKYSFDDGGVQSIGQHVAEGDLWMIQCLKSTAMCQFVKFNEKATP